MAGVRRGFDFNSNTRSSLGWRMIQLLREVKEQPKVIIFENVAAITHTKMKRTLNLFKKDLEEIKNQDVENDLFKDKLDSLNKELHSLNKELTSKSTYFHKLYEDRANGILDDKEYLLLKNKYKDDNNRLEERISNVKKRLNLLIRRNNL